MDTTNTQKPTSSESTEGNLLSNDVPRVQPAGEARPPPGSSLSQQASFLVGGASAPSSSDTSVAPSGQQPVRAVTLRRRQRRQRARARRGLERLSLKEPAGSTASDEPPKASEPKESSSRKRSLGSTPGSTHKPPQKVRKVADSSFSGKAKRALALFVGPLPGETPLTEEEFARAKDILANKVLKRAQNSPEGPLLVESCTHHNGRVRILCGDEATLDWMKAEAKKLAPGPVSRKGYLVTGPGDLPPTRRCTSFVPLSGAGSRKSVLQLLAANNRGLRTAGLHLCLLYTSPSPRDKRQSRMPSSA